ncbi:glycine dehydrogenase subunit 2 [Candidatus Bathyarchaeota archaeon]|nr:MAG: glycine dehydrogenase subunit 2 [Candidatus Bathyarchaeota archaeon]
MYRQARWDEPLIIDRSQPGKIGHLPMRPSEVEMNTSGNVMDLVPSSLRRNGAPPLPEVSEPEVVRHFVRLSQENYSPDLGIYPLGSCTMKYNPKSSELAVQTAKLEKLHPEQDESTVQGILSLMFHLERMLAEITGMSRMTLQPAAGAHGEYLGCLITRAFHRSKNELEQRTEMIVPDSAHGTNPASAAMAGFKLVVVPSNSEGMVDLEELANVAGPRTAGLMITNPNTLGIFERNILEIARIIHKAGGLLYYDGANFNPLLGKVRPGDMGFDILHLNLHKTFATPHGGGGPGAGPVGVTRSLEKFLPVPIVEFDGKNYYYNYNVPDSIGKIRSFHGNIGILARAYAYILNLGADGLKMVAETAALNTNYVLSRILAKGQYQLPFAPERKHEFVLSAKELSNTTGIRAMDLAKRMLDPLMVEVPETESLQDLDHFVDVLTSVFEEAQSDPETVKSAPHFTSVTRIDDVKASHPKTLTLHWHGASSTQKRVSHQEPIAQVNY